MEDQRGKAMAIESRESLGFQMENPISLKFGQVFTGFGFGCGIGIGVGRPIYLGAIPMLQQVMSATRGATDAFSGIGQHVNSSLRKIGMKNIEAGVGCGVGIGHGFGVGIALKPGVINRIQSSVVQAVTKLMLNMGLGPSLSSMQSAIPGSYQSTVNAYEGKGSFDRSHGSRAEKVLDSFLQSPIFKHEEDTEVNGLADKLRAENNVLQVLLKQQQTIQGLMEENQKLQKVLVEDLKVSPSKLHANTDSLIKSNYPCSDCFECRRRKRKAGR